VAHKYQDFKNDGIFVADEKASFFVYEIQTKTQSFTGIVAGTSIADYKNNIIKKHEDTLQYRVELFKDYLHQTEFNTEPVLITYPDKPVINSWISEKKKNSLFIIFQPPTKRNTHFGKLMMLMK